MCEHIKYGIHSPPQILTDTHKKKHTHWHMYTGLLQMCWHNYGFAPHRVHAKFNYSSEPLVMLWNPSFAPQCIGNQQTAHYADISNPSNRTGNLSFAGATLFEPRSVKHNLPCDWLHCCGALIFFTPGCLCICLSSWDAWMDPWMDVWMSGLPSRLDKHWDVWSEKDGQRLGKWLTLCLPQIKFQAIG